MDLVECGLNVWFHDDGYVYIIPWGRSSISDSLSELIDQIDWIEEYGYWNNTDGPEQISEDEWDARSKKWVEVGPNDSYANFARSRLSHVICNSSDTFGLLLLEEFHRQKKKISW